MNTPYDEYQRMVVVRMLGCELSVVLDVDPESRRAVEGGYSFSHVDDVRIVSPADYEDETGEPMTLDGMIDALTDHGTLIAQLAVAKAAFEDADEDADDGDYREPTYGC